MKQFHFHSELPVSVQTAFTWHLRKGAFERLTPPWRNVEFLFPSGPVDEEDSRVGLKVHMGLSSFRWILKHTHFLPDQEFTDVQVEGPFSQYAHRHRFVPLCPDACSLHDEITYASKFPLVANWIEKEFVRLFTWRHALLREDLKTYTRYSREPMRILVSGSTGLIGSALTTFLRLCGHQVFRLIRGEKPLAADAVCWDPEKGHFEKESFEGFDAVIHLAGTNIAEKRWSKAQKEKLWISRCRDSWLLSQILSRLDHPPKTVVCASAVGYYGNRGEQQLSEESSQGEGFLADLCGKWETAFESTVARGARLVHARFGAVLSAKGGMLSKILLPMRLGLGGRMGSGDQWVSWIGIDDAVSALYHILKTDLIEGPVNMTAPCPVRQRELIEQLSKKLHRPAFCHAPRFALRMLLGQMADELLLSSTRAAPDKLLQTGYVFRHPDLKTALNFVM